jgi:hypothetical protein
MESVVLAVLSDCKSLRLDRFDASRCAMPSGGAERNMKISG